MKTPKGIETNKVNIDKLILPAPAVKKIKDTVNIMQSTIIPIMQNKKNIKFLNKFLENGFVKLFKTISLKS